MLTKNETITNSTSLLVHVMSSSIPTFKLKGDVFKCHEELKFDSVLTPMTHNKFVFIPQKLTSNRRSFTTLVLRRTAYKKKIIRLMTLKEKVLLHECSCSIIFKNIFPNILFPLVDIYFLYIFWSTQEI